MSSNPFSNIPGTNKLAELYSVKNIVFFPHATLLVLLYLYGLYTFLFGLYIRMVWSRHHTRKVTIPRHPFLVLSNTGILFILSTIFVVARTIYQVHDAAAKFNVAQTADITRDYPFVAPREYATLIILTRIIPVLSNIAADCILIHRCWLVWDTRRRVAIPLIIASGLVNVFGLVANSIMLTGLIESVASYNETRVLHFFVMGNVLLFVFMISSAIFNLALTILTALRIWWVRRESQRLYRDNPQLPGPNDTMVSWALRMILESGLLYPMCITLHLVLLNSTFPGLGFDFSSISVLAAGIAPTLLLVAANFKNSTQEIQEKISQIHSLDRQPAGEISMRSESRYVDLTQRREGDTVTINGERKDMTLA